MNLTCSYAYDIRGWLGDESNENITRRIGCSYCELLIPPRGPVGGDVRCLASNPLKQALVAGLADAGVDVINFGLTGTEEIYFAAFHLDGHGGIEVTNSHNFKNHNSVKPMRRGTYPISRDTGLKEILRLVEGGDFPPAAKCGTLSQQSVLGPNVDHLLGC